MSGQQRIQAIFYIMLLTTFIFYIALFTMIIWSSEVLLTRDANIYYFIAVYYCTVYFITDTT